MEHVNMFLWRYCSGAKTVRLDNYFWGGGGLRVSHTSQADLGKRNRDHLTGSINNTQHLAENPKHLAAIIHFVLPSPLCVLQQREENTCSSIGSHRQV